MLIRIIVSVFCFTLVACEVKVDVADNDQYTFHEVSFPGADFTDIVSVNNDDKALGLYKVSSFFEDSWRLFVYDIDQETYQNIPLGNIDIGNTVFALDFNDLGDIVVHDFDPTYYDASLGEFVVLPLPGEDYVEVRLMSINNTGKIAGYHFPPYGEQPGVKRGFIFDLATNSYQYLNYPGALQTLFFGINDNGYAVGQYFIDDDTTAITVYDLEQNSFINIPRDTGNWQASDINNENVIVIKTRREDCTAGQLANDTCEYGYWLYDVNNDTLENVKVPTSFSGDTNSNFDFAGSAGIKYNLTGAGEQIGIIGKRR